VSDHARTPLKRESQALRLGMGYSAVDDEMPLNR